MDNFLIDRETLGKFVDEFIKQKPPTIIDPEEINVFRENAIQSLDDRIGLAIFSQLTEEQDAEFNQLLDSGEGSEEVFREFFNRVGVDLEASIARAVRQFGDEFLGRGQNG